MKAPITAYIAEGLGFGSCIISGVSLVGYILGIPGLYTWNIGTGMALPTAMSLFMNGSAIFILAGRSLLR